MEKRLYHNFIVEPLIEYLEEGTEIIDSLFSLHKRKKFVDGLPESDSAKENVELKHNKQATEQFKRLTKHQHKSKMAQTRAKFLEDDELIEAIERFTLYVTKAKDSYEEDNKDGFFDASEQASMYSLTALKKLYEYQEQASFKKEA